jgi:hypothetical protein
MELASINIVVQDADAALATYLKLIGTNNVSEIIKLTGLKDDTETVDGYWLKTRPLNLALFTPHGDKGRMGQLACLQAQLLRQVFRGGILAGGKRSPGCADKVRHQGLSHFTDVAGRGL